MTEYPSNSNRSKEKDDKDDIKDERKVEKIVTGPVITKKKGIFERVKGEIISNDAKNIKSYIMGEILVPSLKKAISDVFTNGIDILLYGEPKGRNRNNNGRYTADRISYRSFYDSPPDDYSTSRSSYGRDYSYDNIILSTRGEAESVLARMDELVYTYGLVRVADLYDLVGVTGDYTDNKYGWTSLRTATIVRVRDGYQIKLPRAVPID